MAIFPLRLQVAVGLLCSALAVNGAHAQKSAFVRKGPAPTGNAHQQLQHLLVTGLPGGVAAQAPPAFFQPDTLYQQIDGAADVYLLYEFRELLHQDFKSGKTEITADIYDMGKLENAFGIYAAERSPNYKFLTIGIEGYGSKGILNFVQDRYYVKLNGSGPNADPLLDQFADLLSARIAGERTRPSLLRKFPADHRVLHSEQYIRKDPLGHAFLAPAYVSTYSWQPEGKILISLAGDAAKAKSRLDQLSKHFKQSGECAPLPQAGVDAIRAKNSYEGRVLARTQGSYLVLVLNPPQNGERILKTIAETLQ